MTLSQLQHHQEQMEAAREEFKLKYPEWRERILKETIFAGKMDEPRLELLGWEVFLIIKGLKQ